MQEELSPVAMHKSKGQAFNQNALTLPTLFLMSVLSKTLFTLMRCHLMSFPLLTAWHNKLFIGY